MNIEKSQQKYLNLLILPVIGLALALYHQILDFDFLLNFDDDLLILNSPQVQSLNGSNIALVFSNFHEGLYHPITTLAWMLQYHFFGADPFGFHLVSLCLHCLNILLVFFLAKRVGKHLGVGLIAALLFAVHPMHVENVAWVSAQKDLIMGLFFLGGLLSYSSYLDSKKNFYLFFTTVFGILAMLSKATAMTFPLVLLLMDWLKGEKDWKRSIVQKLPLIALGLVSLILNLIAQSKFNYLSDLTDDHGILERISFVFYAVFYYLQKLVLPLDLSPKNLYPETTVPILYFLSIPIVLLLAFIGIRFRDKLKWWAFGLAFFFLLIAPTLKLLPTGNDIVSNRYAYMAFIGLYIAIAHYLVHINVFARVVIVAALIGFWQREAFVYTPVFENGQTVWSAVIEAHEDREWGLAMAYNERGQVAYKDGKYAMAQKDIDKALSIDPNLKRALLNRANLYDRYGKFEEALEDLNVLLKEDPDNVTAIKIRSTIYGKMENTAAALKDVERALELDPNNPELYNNLGILSSMQGDHQKAEESFEKALELQPIYLQARMNLGKLLLEIDREEEALKELALVYEKDPEIYYNAYLLGRTYLKMGEKEKSERILRKFAENQKQASQIANSFYRDSLYEASIPYYTIALGDRDIRSRSLYQRAQAYKQLDQKENALDDLLAVIEVVPNPQFFFEIGELYQQMDDQAEACHFYHEAEIREHPEAIKRMKEYCAGVEIREH